MWDWTTLQYRMYVTDEAPMPFQAELMEASMGSTAPLLSQPAPPLLGLPTPIPELNPTKLNCYSWSTPDVVKWLDKASLNHLRELYVESIDVGQPFLKRTCVNSTHRYWSYRKLCHTRSICFYLCSSCSFSDFDGVMLVELISLQRISPDVYYSFLREEFRMTLKDVLRLNAALRNLLANSWVFHLV